ncbi:MAG: hypothetical protein ACRBFS_13595 [Aureispira sp.]
MTKREQAAQLIEELKEIAGEDAVSLDVLHSMEEEYKLLYEEDGNYEDGEEEEVDSYNLEEAYLHYQSAAINYVQQIDLCLLQQLARERLAYDLFMCVADDSSISPTSKIIKKNVASELIEMIPKVGEYIEIASDINSEIIDAQVNTSEVNVRYGAIKNSIALIDVSPNGNNVKFSTTVENHIEFLLDKTLLIDDVAIQDEGDVYNYYIKIATLINSYTIKLRDKSSEIQAFIPKNKNNYKSAMDGLLKKSSVASMFKHYLVDWLNSSGHYIDIFCNFTQKGMDYRIDHNSPVKSFIYEPGMFGSEDIAVTNSLVSLGLLSAPNAPITESKIRNFGLKFRVDYPLDIKYRKN